MKNHTISATWIKYQLVINVMRLTAERCVRHHVTAVTNDTTANATEKLGSFFFMSKLPRLVTLLKYCFSTDKCAWNDFSGHCFKDGNNFLQKSQMQNDYAPVELEEVEEEVQQCKNDTKLKWDCDSR